MTGNIRGSGKEGEHLETQGSRWRGIRKENVRGLLEPYKRRVI
jgi:hypothetical protein